MNEEDSRPAAALSPRKPVHWGWWVALAAVGVGYVWAMATFLMRGGGLWQAVASTVAVGSTCAVAWALRRRRERTGSDDESLAADEALRRTARRWVLPLLVGGALLMALSLWLVYG